MIISMAILIFMLLIIPASWASAETVSRDGVLVIGKINDPAAKKVLRSYQKTKKFDELDEKTWTGLKEAKDLLQIVRDKLE
jgi:hypothetical protein